MFEKFVTVMSRESPTELELVAPFLLVRALKIIASDNDPIFRVTCYANI